jgi:hypothetical protein
MSVYIDDARIPWRGRLWSHLVAHSAEELHDAAEALGLRRAWAQDAGATLHYDLPEAWRTLAIERGVAEPLDWRELTRRRAEFAPGRRTTRRRAVAAAAAGVPARAPAD